MNVNCDKSQEFIDNYAGCDFKRKDFSPAQLRQIESFIKMNKK